MYLSIFFGFCICPAYSLSVLRVGVTERHSVVGVVASEEQPAKRADIIVVIIRCQNVPLKARIRLHLLPLVNDFNLEALERFKTLLTRAGRGAGM